MKQIKNLILFAFIVVFFSVALNAQECESLYRDNTASYINQLTKSIAKQYVNAKNSTHLKEKNILIMATYESGDMNKSLPITQRIDENLMYEMAQNGFKIVDSNTMKYLNLPEVEIAYILVSTYTNYKYEMVINSRIIDKKTGVIQASAQVQVPRKVLKDVEKLYNKNSWFTPKE